MSTIKDVAKLAGVSVSTVSRALSGRTFVEEETKQKVLEVVQELNYKPNIIAKGLREGEFCTIALIVPDINSLFYPALMKNIEKEAAEKGYSLILCNTNNSVEKEKQAVEMLSSRGVAGIICMSVEDDIRNLLTFKKETNIPVVLINRYSEVNLGTVSIDDEHGGYLMTKLLLEKGHRKIAGMFGSFEKRRFRERYNGCKRAMEELAGKAVEMLVNQIENKGTANEIIVQGNVKERQSVIELPLD